MTITEPLPPFEPFYSDFVPRRPSFQEKSSRTSSPDSYFVDNNDTKVIKGLNDKPSKNSSLGSIFVDNYERNVMKGPNDESRYYQESPLYTQSEYYDDETIYGTSPPVFE